MSIGIDIGKYSIKIVELANDKENHVPYCYRINSSKGSATPKDFLRRKYFDISEFKSIGLFEIIFSIRKYLKMIKFLKDQIKSINYD